MRKIALLLFFSIGAQAELTIEDLDQSRLKNSGDIARECNMKPRLGKYACLNHAIRKKTALERFLIHLQLWSSGRRIKAALKNDDAETAIIEFNARSYTIFQILTECDCYQFDSEGIIGAQENPASEFRQIFLDIATSLAL